VSPELCPSDPCFVSCWMIVLADGRNHKRAGDESSENASTFHVRMVLQ
jgi:hypothetical protein